MPADPSTLLLSFPEEDSQIGVSRATLAALARKFEICEEDVIHLALARMVVAKQPGYAPDDGPLSDGEIAALRAHANAVLPQTEVMDRKSLF